MSDRRGTMRVENHECKVYVGNLGEHGDKSELDRTFGKYGAVKSVWVLVVLHDRCAFGLSNKRFLCCHICNCQNVKSW